MSQATLHVFEAISIVEYNEADTDWAFLYTYLYDNRMQNIIGVALQDNVEIKSMYAHFAKELDALKLEFREAIVNGNSLKINKNEIEINRLDYANTRNGKPGVFHAEFNLNKIKIIWVN